ncbi:zinc finger MYM-type protein 1 [Trichonephila clavipes]|nr:zinc finger MYM-type protein 1 [Trichonephila clavipes]
MVLKANDRRTSCPCHDEFRGPRSDYVRQVALATTQQQLLFFHPTIEYVEKHVKEIGNSCLENHKNSILVWLTRKENKSVLDRQLQEQLRKDTGYYHNVFKWVISVIKSLHLRGLAIRGTEKVFGSPHNGNFMGTLELLAEFNPFIREHIEQRELQPKSLISYLSKTIYEQIIEIMGKQIIKTITTQINNDDTKYYSIVMDSTPDLSYNDQLAIVLRYCFRGKVYER